MPRGRSCLPSFFLRHLDAKRASRVPLADDTLGLWGSWPLLGAAGTATVGSCWPGRLWKGESRGRLVRVVTEEAGLIYPSRPSRTLALPGTLASRLIRKGWGDCNLAEVGSSRSQTRKRRETHVAEGARGVCGQRRGEAAQPADRVRGAAGRSSLLFLWVGHTLVPLALMAPSTRST